MVTDCGLLKTTAIAACGALRARTTEAAHPKGAAAGVTLDESACTKNAFPVLANVLARKESHCSEMVHDLPPIRISASVSDFGPTTRAAVSQRIGDTIGDTRRPVTNGSGFTNTFIELSDAAIDGQNRPSWMGTRTDDALEAALVTDA